MRRFFVASLSALAVLGSVLVTGRSSDHAEALGVPSQLPFHWRVPYVARDGYAGVHQGDLAAAEARWAQFGSPNYRITIVLNTYPIVETHTVYVTGGIAGDIHSRCTLGPDLITCPPFKAADYTVAKLFELIRTKQANVPLQPSPFPGDFFVDVMYDQYLGHPVRIEYGLRGVLDQITTVIVDDLVITN